MQQLQHKNLRHEVCERNGAGKKASCSYCNCARVYKLSHLWSLYTIDNYLIKLKLRVDFYVAISSEYKKMKKEV